MIRRLKRIQIFFALALFLTFLTPPAFFFSNHSIELAFLSLPLNDPSSDDDHLTPDDLNQLKATGLFPATLSWLLNTNLFEYHLHFLFRTVPHNRRTFPLRC